MSTRRMLAVLGGAMMMAATLASASSASAQGRQRAPTAEQNLAAAQASATAAGLSCQVTEATLLGLTSADHSLYEASCASGPGYLITASTPPETIDCVLVAAEADRQAAAAAAAPPPATPPAEGAEPAPPPLRCKLAGNLDINAVLAGYAREAGITCQVDGGPASGPSRGQHGL